MATATDNYPTTTATRKRPHSFLSETNEPMMSGALPTPVATRLILVHLNTLLSSTRAVAHTLRTAVADGLPNLASAPSSPTATSPANPTTASTTTTTGPAGEQQQLDLTQVSDAAIHHAFARAPYLPSILAELGLDRELSAEEDARLAKAYRRVFHEQGMGMLELEAGAREFLAAARAVNMGGGGARRDVGVGDGEGGGHSEEGGSAAAGEMVRASAAAEKGERLAVAVVSNNVAVAGGVLGRLEVLDMVDAVLPSPAAQTTAVISNEAVTTWVQAITDWFNGGASNNADIPPLLPKQVTVVSCAPYDLALPQAAGFRTYRVCKPGQEEVATSGSSAQPDLVVDGLEELRVELFKKHARQRDTDDMDMGGEDDSEAGII